MRRRIIAILTGGLIAATLDIVAAALMYRVQVDVVFKSIAAGWIGRKAALAGGLPEILLGAASHYVIALVAASLYVLAGTRLAVLITRPWLCGPLFGLIVWGVMNFAVVPLSRTGSGPWTVTLLIESLLVHAFVFGLPIALAASRFGRPISAPDQSE
jgi:hypothetical protein